MLEGSMERNTLMLTVKLFQDEQRRRFEEADMMEEAAKIKPFKTKDGQPSEKWVRGFLSRHPEIKIRKASKKTRLRLKVTYKDVEEFFLKWIKTSVGVPPENILNMDETAIKMCALTQKVSRKEEIELICSWEV